MKWEEQQRQWREQSGAETQMERARSVQTLLTRNKLSWHAPELSNHFRLGKQTRKSYCPSDRSSPCDESFRQKKQSGLSRLCRCGDDKLFLLSLGRDRVCPNTESLLPLSRVSRAQLHCPARLYSPHSCFIAQSSLFSPRPKTLTIYILFTKLTSFSM